MPADNIHHWAEDGDCEAIQQFIARHRIQYVFPESNSTRAEEKELKDGKESKDQKSKEVKKSTDVPPPAAVMPQPEVGSTALLDQKDDHGKTALLITCEAIRDRVIEGARPRYFEFAKILIDAGADLNVKNAEGESAFIILTKAFIHRVRSEREDKQEANQDEKPFYLDINHINDERSLILYFVRNGLDLQANQAQFDLLMEEEMKPTQPLNSRSRCKELKTYCLSERIGQDTFQSQITQIVTCDPHVSINSECWGLKKYSQALLLYFENKFPKDFKMNLSVAYDREVCEILAKIKDRTICEFEVEMDLLDPNYVALVVSSLHNFIVYNEFISRQGSSELFYFVLHIRKDNSLDNDYGNAVVRCIANAFNDKLAKNLFALIIRWDGKIDRKTAEELARVRCLRELELIPNNAPVFRSSRGASWATEKDVITAEALEQFLKQAKYLKTFKFPTVLDDSRSEYKKAIVRGLSENFSLNTMCVHESNRVGFEYSNFIVANHLASQPASADFSAVLATRVTEFASVTSLRDIIVSYLLDPRMFHLLMIQEKLSAMLPVEVKKEIKIEIMESRQELHPRMQQEFKHDDPNVRFPMLQLTATRRGLLAVFDRHLMTHATKKFHHPPLLHEQNVIEAVMIDDKSGAERGVIRDPLELRAFFCQGSLNREYREDFPNCEPCINAAQKNRVSEILSVHFDKLNALSANHTIAAFQAVLAKQLDAKEIDRFKREKVWDSIEFIRGIFTHPCPQNEEKNPESAGLLALTPLDDKALWPVTKEAVVNYVRYLIESQLSFQESLPLLRSFVPEELQKDVTFRVTQKDELWIMANNPMMTEYYLLQLINLGEVIGSRCYENHCGNEFKVVYKNFRSFKDEFLNESKCKEMKISELYVSEMLNALIRVNIPEGKKDYGLRGNSFDSKSDLRADVSNNVLALYKFYKTILYEQVLPDIKMAYNALSDIPYSVKEKMPFIEVMLEDMLKHISRRVITPPIRVGISLFAVRCLFTCSYDLLAFAKWVLVDDRISDLMAHPEKYRHPILNNLLAARQKFVAYDFLNELDAVPAIRKNTRQKIVEYMFSSYELFLLVSVDKNNSQCVARLLKTIDQQGAFSKEIFEKLMHNVYQVNFISIIVNAFPPEVVKNFKHYLNVLLDSTHLPRLEQLAGAITVMIASRHNKKLNMAEFQKLLDDAAFAESMRAVVVADRQKPASVAALSLLSSNASSAARDEKKQQRPADAGAAAAAAPPAAVPKKSK